MRTRVWDIVALLEACYRIEQTEQGWLEGCAEAARPFIDRGLGHIAVTYELARSGEETFPARVIAGPAEFERKAPHILKMIPLELVRAWKRRTLGCASGEPSQHAFRDEDRRPGFAMPDGFLAMGTEFADRGCVLAGRLAHPKLTAAQRDVCLRLAAHLGAGYRLRWMLEQVRASPDAVVHARWNVLHADGEKRSDSVLRELTGNPVDDAASSHGWGRPEEPLPSWRTRVSARWTLFEVLEPDGRRFVALHDARLRRRIGSALSWRERQAMELLALEQTNKQIAFELGVSASTAGVLLHRAAQKLGTRTRTELLARAKALEPVNG